MLNAVKCEERQTLIGCQCKLIPLVTSTKNYKHAHMFDRIYYHVEASKKGANNEIQGCITYSGRKQEHSATAVHPKVQYLRKCYPSSEHR